MKEIIIKQLGVNNIDMLVEFYIDRKMIDWRVFTDTRDIQEAMANFLFGRLTIEHI